MNPRDRNELDDELKRVLDADAAPRPLRPMWPEVARRRRRAAAPLLDLRFSLATAAALTVGVFIGALTFNGGGEAVTSSDEQTVATSTDWTSETGPTMADLYLFDAVSGESLLQ